MTKKETKKINGAPLEIGNQSTNIPYEDPSRKRSVRTTFRLEKDTFSNMESLSKYYKITKKELIEFLVDTVQTFADSSEQGESLLNRIDNKTSGQTQKADLIRKTQVISKKSLNTLNKLSNDTGFSRDQLIKFAVIIHKFNFKRTRKNHEKALKDIKKLVSKIEETEKTLKKYLDPNDPVLTRFGNIPVIANNLSLAIESEINEGVPVDPDGK